TAGRTWNDWAGGSSGMFIYSPVLSKTQEVLSSQAEEASYLVGQPLKLVVNPNKHPEVRNFKMARTFQRAVQGKPAVPVELETDRFPEKDAGQPAGKADAKADAKVEVKDGEGKGEKVEVKGDGGAPKAKDVAS